MAFVAATPVLATASRFTTSICTTKRTFTPVLPSKAIAKNTTCAVLDVDSAKAPPKSDTEYDYLANLTTIVADTGEVEAVARLRPNSSTTNPSLVAKAAEMPEYENLVQEAVDYGRSVAKNKGNDAMLVAVRDKLFTLFGREILKHIPGDVSTEVDARLSFSVDRSVAKAEDLIKLYDDIGVSKDRVLIKLASTWEGLCACKILESRGIRTNMTLMFSVAQAAVAAENGAFLVSPFVGRILDWHKKASGRDSFPAEEDPGVLSVRQIYNYFKANDFSTVVMGASFRNKEEILALAGCDRLTISPKFIDALKNTKAKVEAKLDAEKASQMKIEKIGTDEESFRWLMNEDAMATEKLAEGIRGFTKDLVKLDRKLSDMLL